MSTFNGKALARGCCGRILIVPSFSGCIVRQEPSTERLEAQRVTDGEHLHDIEQKLRCWGYLAHYPDAEHDVAWLLDQLAERDACIVTVTPSGG
jgi:hypothetical protein